MLTVIIATRNRPEKLKNCLLSLLEQTKIAPDEIIVVDQSDNNKTRLLVNYLRQNYKLISFIKQDFTGKSKALNAGIRTSHADIFAFTDDDCIISKTWIAEIIFSFTNYPEIACVTGNTYPYENCPPWSCPPIINTKTAMFTQPTHHKFIGYGNNFAISKSTLKSIGLFKTWLGPGSISMACEDGEILLRILTEKYKIFHNAKMIVFHDKKLNTPAIRTQNLSYICGEMACYEYYALYGWRFARDVINRNLINSFQAFKRIAGDILKRKIIRIEDWGYVVNTILVKAKGVAIGLFYFIKIAVFKIEDSKTLMN